MCIHFLIKICHDVNVTSYLSYREFYIYRVSKKRGDWGRMASNKKGEENRPPLKFKFTYYWVFQDHFDHHVERDYEPDSYLFL